MMRMYAYQQTVLQQTSAEVRFASALLQEGIMDYKD